MIRSFSPREGIWLVETDQQDDPEGAIARFSPREGIWLVETSASCPLPFSVNSTKFQSP